MLLNGGSGGTRPFDTFPLVPLPLKEEKKNISVSEKRKKKVNSKLTEKKLYNLIYQDKHWEQGRAPQNKNCC